MGSLIDTLVVLLLVTLFLGSGIWVFLGLILVATSGLVIVNGFSLHRIALMMEPALWSSATTWELSAIPLFVWMGEILFRTDVSERLFRGLTPLARNMPGRLLHTNVLGSALFASISGSSAATTATVGKISIAALAERGYSKGISMGSLAGAGSLGILIPPSIPMIIYGVQAEVSITDLFLSGFLPGIMMAGLYSAYIAVACWLKPSLAPADGQHKFTIGVLCNSILDLWPILALIIIVMGGIYSGVVTPAEAAAIGVLAAVLITAAMGSLSFAILSESLVSSVQTSCMIGTILVAASFLSSAFGYMHIPAGVAQAVGAMHLSPLGLIVILTAVYLLLGCLLDGVSMIVMTLPLVYPLIVAAGFHPVWFGVYLMLMIELAMITPPIGFNLFVIQAIANEPLFTVAKSAAPFFLLMLLGVVTLYLFPSIALFLPMYLKG
jgi:tripartite ATP-independent transporter DctM subunit